MDNILQYELTAAEAFIEISLRVGIWFVFVWLENQTPIIRHIDEEELWYYRYPSQISLIPKPYFYTFITIVPIIVFILQYIIKRNEKNIIYDICLGVCGVTMAYCINGIFTACLKLLIGRPRPNFFHRCFPEGYGTNLDECTGDYTSVMDARKSFPSGHASFAFAGMVYMALHLIQIVNLNERRMAKGPIIFAISLLPLMAVIVAASRTADYHHHFSDAIVGAVMGTLIACCVFYCYNQPTEEQSFGKHKENVKQI